MTFLALTVNKNAIIEKYASYKDTYICMTFTYHARSIYYVLSPVLLVQLALFLNVFIFFLEILIKIGSSFHQAQLPMEALPVLVLNLNSLTRFADEKVS